MPVPQKGKQIGANQPILLGLPFIEELGQGSIEWSERPIIRKPLHLLGQTGCDLLEIRRIGGQFPCQIIEEV